MKRISNWWTAQPYEAEYSYFSRWLDNDKKPIIIELVGIKKNCPLQISDIHLYSDSMIKELKPPVEIILTERINPDGSMDNVLDGFCHDWFEENGRNNINRKN